MSFTPSSNSLSPKQKVFCEEFVKDFNASAAAKRAGYSYESGDRNLKNPYILAYIELITSDATRIEFSRETAIANVEEIRSLAMKRCDLDIAYRAEAWLEKYSDQFDNKPIKYIETSFFDFFPASPGDLKLSEDQRTEIADRLFEFLTKKHKRISNQTLDRKVHLMSKLTPWERRDLVQRMARHQYRIDCQNEMGGDTDRIVSSVDSSRFIEKKLRDAPVYESDKVSGSSKEVQHHLRNIAPFRGAITQILGTNQVRIELRFFEDVQSRLPTTGAGTSSPARNLCNLSNWLIAL